MKSTSLKSLTLKLNVSIILMLAITGTVFAMGEDDPWLTKVMGELSYHQPDNADALEWNIDAWLGRDLYKFWLKTDGEYEKTPEEKGIEQATIELVYSSTVSAYWDMQMGVRHDLKPEVNGDTRNWLSFGFMGTAPYFVEIDGRLFIGEESSTQLLIEAEREIMLTQQWVLTPELDVVANLDSNDKYQEGAGLAQISLELRIGYEKSRKFQPFFGVSANQYFGETKRLIEADGEEGNSLELMIGIHAWF